MRPNRREFLGRCGPAAALAMAGAAVAQDRAADREEPAPRGAATGRHPIGVSTYSFWQFRGERPPSRRTPPASTVRWACCPPVTPLLVLIFRAFM